ncbi:hypothetical protein [Halobaculum sp. MBLA0143]
MPTTQFTAETDAEIETETDAEIVTDGGSAEPLDPAKALLEDAAGL